LVVDHLLRGWRLMKKQKKKKKIALLGANSPSPMEHSTMIVGGAVWCERQVKGKHEMRD